MLKRSNQTRLIATYFGGAFGLLQIIDILIDSLNLPPEIINYLLVAIVIGFICILFYSYIPSIKTAKIENIKNKRYFLQLLGIIIIFTLSISNIFLFNKSSLGSIRQEAYTDGFILIDSYLDKENFISAYEIANKYSNALPEDSLVREKLNLSSLETAIYSSPDGADVFYKRIDSENWIKLGKTPLKTRIPRGFINFKISKDGYADHLSLTHAGFIKNHSKSKDVNYYQLTPISTIPENMVKIPGGDTRLYVSALTDLNTLNIQSYWIDKYEVTNQEFQIFIDAGGYRNEKFWHKNIKNEDGENIHWKDAMKLFIDKSGLNGPGTWSEGTYPIGQENFPVTGLSWYEASAYAKWAGKQLPTIYHWYKAAMVWGETSIISPRSNFNGSKSEVGKYDVLSVFGCYDMAGNAREWGSNPHKNGNHSIMGGGYDDETYFFTDNFSQHPMNRYKTNGFRCAIIFDKGPIVASMDTMIQTYTRDFYSHNPISDELFNVYRGMFQYDSIPLNEVVLENQVNVNKVWSKQLIEIDAAYGSERLPLNVYIPNNRPPPYKTIVFVPGSNAITSRNSKNKNGNNFGYLMRSGYALIEPIFKGTYERHYKEFNNYLQNPSKNYANQMIMMVKDFARTIDYVESKDELLNDVFYYGISWGGMLGPIFLANEDRIGCAVWQVAGLGARDMRPEANPINYLSKIKQPVLMLNGIYDQYFPHETSQMPMYDLLAVQEPYKKMITYESAHSPPKSQTSKEILEWFNNFSSLD